MYVFFSHLLTILGLRYPVEINVEQYYDKNSPSSQSLSGSINSPQKSKRYGKILNPQSGQNPVMLRRKTGSLDISALGELNPDKSIIEDDLDAMIDIECIRIPKFTDFRRHWKQILYWFYSTLVFLLLLVQPGFLIWKAIKEKNLALISNITFLVIPPLEQLIIIKYFRSHSFDKIYYEVCKLKDTSHWIKDDRRMSLIILGPSIISIIISVVYIFIGDEVDNIYTFFQDDITTPGKVFLFIFELACLMYSRTILFLSLTVFFFVFFKHLNDMRALLYTLKYNNVWVDDQTIVSEFIHAIIKLRHELNGSIEKLSNVYVFATVLGAVGIGNVIDNLKIDSFTIISCIIFGICQIVFLFIIFLISEQQRKLGNIIRHPVFSLKYIYRRYRTLNFDLSPVTLRTPVSIQDKKSINNIIEDELKDFSATSTGRLLKSFRARSMRYQSATATINSGGKLYDVKNAGSMLDEDKKKIVPLGTFDDLNSEDDEEIPVNSKKVKIVEDNNVKIMEEGRLENVEEAEDTSDSDMNSFTSSEGIIEFKTEKHNSYIDNSNDSNDINESSTDDKNIKNLDVSPITRDIVKKINQISNYNGSSIDYIILHLLISDNWTTNFDLLGMKFDNTGAIKKAVAITSMIMLASGLISELQIFF